MLHLLTLLAGLVLLLGGAEVLVRSARSFGLRVGLSPVVVGLTIVAYGTSTPELVVSTAATLEGHKEIALANVVGSNICNILLILGLCALIRPMGVHSRILRIEAPMVVGISIAVSALLLVGEVGRLAGAALLLGLVGYTAWTVKLARVESATIAADIGDAQLGATRSSWTDAGMAAASLGLLFGGASLFVRGAADLAAALGTPPVVVGLTVVAIGTSLPELATSVVAALRGHGDIAIANVLGSNFFNLSGVLGTAALVDPIGSQDGSPTDLFAMIASAAVLLGFLYTRQRLGRWEGALLLCGYGLYLATLMR
ncbi:MAG: calcium/sodium antiporter [Myxococcales bacterium]|nr:calcium/sodium antiporter [Myxococcales bacterium]